MLYNKWRPRLFKDIIGQEKNTEIIRNQIKENRVAHAYLFCGTRGTGKTTTAKVLAKAVNAHDENGEPILNSEISNKIDKGISIDVQEIDAASKRKIGDMRDIISNVQYPPQEGKYKVIILDEVHMLTQEAVNAFLKTLEEPPEYVIFILATTDPQKLPVTILSRCQKFDFRRIRKDAIEARLTFIANKESIKIDKRILALIAKVSGGAMRDAISILDQVKDLNNITYEKVIELLGIAGNSVFFKLSKSIFSKDIYSALNIVNDDIDEKGIDFNIFFSEYVAFLRNILISKIMGKSNNINMSDEDINSIIELSKNINSDDIIRIINIFQSVISKDRISLEISIIKSISTAISTGDKSNKEENIERENSKTNTKNLDGGSKPKDIKKETNVPTSSGTKKNTIPKNSTAKKTNEIFKSAKIKVVNGLLGSKNICSKKAGKALKDSKIYLMKSGKQIILEIASASKADDGALIHSSDLIKKGFEKYTSTKNIEIITKQVAK